MTAISHVVACNPQSMIDFATDLMGQNDTFTGRIEQMNRDVDNALGGWRGDAATAASGRALAGKLAGNHLGSTVVTIADHYNAYGSELVGYRTALVNLVYSEIPNAGMTVDDDGNVKAPQTPTGANPTTAGLVQQMLEAQATGFQTRAKSLLVQFGYSEGAAAQSVAIGLQELGAYEKSPDGLPARPEVQAVLDNKTQLPADPQQLHDFWEGLTPAEKDALYEHDRFIGNRDGIPQIDRDHYNRQTLDALRDAKRYQIAAAQAELAQAGDKQWWQNQIGALQTQLAGYDAVSGQLGTQEGVPRLLSTIDDQGRAAIAVRNPDTAGNIATYVPGTGQNIASIDQGVDRAERMRQSAEKLDPTKQTSVISWYGYNAPPTLGDATKTDFADRAAGPLDGYQDGLRVTHEGERSMNTVVGHSYGTTAIGHAASNGHTLDADRMILVASPGIGVDKPTDLSMTGVDPDDNAHRIWVTTNSHDIIKATPNFIHGPQPWDTPGFGTQFHSEGSGPWYQFGWSTEAHSSYWDTGNPGLRNMGKIIDGMDTQS